MDYVGKMFATVLDSDTGGAKKALGEMLKLVEDGILVRNTAHDYDFIRYLTQSNRLVVVLKNAQKVLETPENEERD